MQQDCSISPKDRSNRLRFKKFDTSKNKQEMDALHIEKDLELEAVFAGDIAYFQLAGESEMSNFRSPDSYVFIFFETCTGSHSVDFVAYACGDSQVHISFPGQLHSWKTEAGAKGHKLIVSKRFIEMHPCGQRFSILKVNSLPVLDISSDSGKMLSWEFNLIRQGMETIAESSDAIGLRAQLILSMIGNLLDQHVRDETRATKKNPLLSRFAELIESNFTESKSVAFYAGKLAVTPNYLNILSKNHLKLTAKELIDKRIVLEAKRLLLGSDLSIKQIGYSLGFSSSAAFAAFILRKTGFYPKMFRSSRHEDLQFGP